MGLKRLKMYGNTTWHHCCLHQWMEDCHGAPWGALSKTKGENGRPAGASWYDIYNILPVCGNPPMQFSFYGEAPPQLRIKWCKWQIALKGDLHSCCSAEPLPYTSRELASHTHFGVGLAYIVRAVVPHRSTPSSQSVSFTYSHTKGKKKSMSARRSVPVS